jgi:hypothetical protein
MSAYIIDHDSIDLLVTAALRGIGSEGCLRVFHEGEWRTWNRYEDADNLGQILHDTNVDSVNYLYSENTLPTRYQYNGRMISDYLGSPVIPWGQVLGTISCYVYQSCENVETWHTSIGKSIIDAIRLKVCGIIANNDDARWGWTREDVITKIEELKKTVRA